MFDLNKYKKFIKSNIKTIPESKKYKLSEEIIIESLVQFDTTIHTFLGIPETTSRRYLNLIFSDINKPFGAKWQDYLLHIYGYRKCSKCNNFLPLDNFWKHNNWSGLRYECSNCNSKEHKKWREDNIDYNKERYKQWLSSNPGKNTHKSRMYSLRKTKRTPKWLSSEQIKEIENFYIKAKEMSNEEVKFVVDHIIPLKGEKVSGLHVPWNLQIISNSKNARKSNKYDS